MEFEKLIRYRNIASLFLTGLFLLPFQLLAQSGAFRDSLLRLIHSDSGDSLRSRAMADISFYYRNLDVDSGIYWGKQGFQLAKQVGLFNNAARSLNSTGNNFVNKGEYDSALYYFNQSEKFYLMNNDSVSLSATFNNKAIVYDRQGNPEMALTQYQLAADVNEKFKNYKSLANTLENIGNLYRRSLKRYDDALLYTYRSLNIRKQTGDSVSLGSAYSKLADIYFDNRQLDSAIYFYHISLEYDRRFNVSIRQITSLISLGCVYMDLHQLDSAETCLKQAVSLSEKTSFRTWYARALLNYGLLLGYKQDKVNGLAAINKGISIATELKEPGRLKEGYRVLKEFWEFYGDSAKAYGSFIQYYQLNDSLESLQRIETLNNLKEKYETAKKETEIKQLLADKQIAQLDLERKNALIAGKYQEVKVKESQIEILQQEKRIRDLELKEQKALLEKSMLEQINQQKEMELLRLNEQVRKGELDRQRAEKAAILIISFVVISLIVFSFIQFRISQRRKMDNEKHRLLHQLSEMKMEALRAQMNPHFIFNALNSINRYIIRSDKETASDYLVKFSKLMRLILENSKSSAVPLSNELESLRLYVELEMLRFDHKFDFRLDVSSGIDLSGISIPPMIFQPYIENSIWHGLMNKEGKGVVSLSIRQEEQLVLHCVIEDNGIGREKAATLRSQTHGSRKSFGTQITRDRIHLLEGKQNRLQITDLYDEQHAPAGTRVELWLNVQKAA